MKEKIPYSKIVEELSGRDKESKLWAILAMGILRVPEHADSLVDVLGSIDEEIVETALDSLGKIGNPRSLKYILEFFNHGNPKLAEKAVTVLSNFDLKQVAEQVIKYSGPELPVPLRTKLVAQLETIKHPAVSAFMGEILNETQEPALLAGAIGYFIRFPAPEKQAALKAFSNSGQWEISLPANVALSRLRDEGARSHLKRMAKSPSHQVRITLVQCLNKNPFI